ncbi:uncharacterized protein M421DRAFT_342303 [Didymella exigua CBS 183.55]|uniref:Uncharacterized protein n=1 Tax=Didymella exigua CBS 183.55 TaxID=1150837 RepID=A0A6A5RW59_9PLEO|nr:uncharacterized protein M421DRAFT_342303 [Didymella exigua CBS 183.55]KAF1931228.1 hypothetical protein M421DRAFT_342303 [Didymella exigua CBS 183.55]
MFSWFVGWLALMYCSFQALPRFTRLENPSVELVRKDSLLRVSSPGEGLATASELSSQDAVATRVYRENGSNWLLSTNTSQDRARERHIGVM